VLTCLIDWFRASASWFGSVAQWVAGLGTLGAVLVALFKDPYLRWRSRPVLNASIVPRPPDCAKNIASIVKKSTGKVVARTDCYYLRLWIENTGKGRAEQVQVYAASLSRRGKDGQYQPVNTFLPMNLLWSHSRPDAPEVFAAGISSQMGRHCDLGHIIDPPASEKFGAPHTNAVLGICTLILDVEAPPGTGNHLLEPGEYRLEVRVAGANAARVTRVVNIKFDGRWFADERQMLTEGITVSVD
jgi:hypothetical protein